MKGLRKCKQLANQKVRHVDDIADWGTHKKLTSNWGWPPDGKAYRDYDPRSYRK